MSRPEDAPCRSEPDLWFSTDPGNITRARSICATCPLKDPCLRAGIDRKEQGIWGGLDQAEREALSSQQAIGVTVDPKTTRAMAPHQHRKKIHKWHVVTDSCDSVCNAGMTADPDTAMLAADVPAGERCTQRRCVSIWRQLDAMAVDCA